MNTVIVSGRLTKDPWFSDSGKQAVAKFYVACDRAQEGADYPHCVAWGKTAEVVQKYLHKGSRVLVEGRIATGSYQKSTGETVYTTDVSIRRVEFLDAKADGERPPEPAKPKADEFEQLEEEVPF